MALNKQQIRVARDIIAEGKARRAPRHVIRVAIGTFLTENPRMVRGGDRDSEGPFQQRPSQGWGPASESDRVDAGQFFDHAIPLFKKGMRGGQLAQAVQRSAFPGRYKPNVKMAGGILRGLGGAEAAPKPQTAQPSESAKPPRTLAATAPLTNPLAPAVPTTQRPGSPFAQNRGVISSAVGARQEQPAKEPQPAQPVQVQPAQKAAKQVGALRPFKVAARELEKASTPYVWGGAHAGGKAPGPSGTRGYDCSSAVSYVLQQAGVKIPTMVSGDLARTSLLADGPGAVTIYANDGHTFMKIGNKFFGTSRTNPRGGAGFIEGGVDTSGYRVRHVPGLDAKQAKALGVKLGKTGGAKTVKVTKGVKVGHPQYTSQPILPDYAPAPRVTNPLKRAFSF